jgi:hypothetical protein
MNPLDIIIPLRDSDEYIRTIYMRGSCFQFFQFLRSIFKEAIPCMSIEKNHVVSLIDGKMYDITGEIPKEHEQYYKPFTREDWITVREWSFAAHNLIYIAKCKFCGEPFTISTH